MNAGLWHIMLIVSIILMTIFIGQDKTEAKETKEHCFYFLSYFVFHCYCKIKYLYAKIIIIQKKNEEA